MTAACSPTLGAQRLIALLTLLKLLTGQPGKLGQQGFAKLARKKTNKSNQSFPNQSAGCSACNSPLKKPEAQLGQRMTPKALLRQDLGRGPQVSARVPWLLLAPASALHPNKTPIHGDPERKARLNPFKKKKKRKLHFATSPSGAEECQEPAHAGEPGRGGGPSPRGAPR